MSFRFLRPIPINNRVAALILLLATLAQSCLLLFIVDAGQGGVLGSDGPYYHRIALNLRHHGAFSNAIAPPYEPTIFRAPGYSFFLAGIYTLSNDSLLAVRVVQLAMWGFTAWLLFLVAQRFVSRGVALLVTLLQIFLWPMSLLPIFHLTEAPATLFTVWLVWLLFCWQDRVEANNVSTRLAVGIGVLCGVMALLRPSLALLILLPPIWMIWTTRKRALLPVLVCGAAFTLCVLSWTARNYMVSGKPIPFAASSGISSWVSAEQYRGKFSYGLPTSDWKVIVAGQDARRAELHQQLRDLPANAFPVRSIQSELEEDKLYRADARASWNTLSTAEIIREIPARVAYLWANGDEAPWAEGNLWPYLLFWAFLTNGILRWKRFKHAGRDLLLLLSVPIYLSLIHLIFHVESRYSYPGRPFLILLAVFGVVALFDVVLKSTRRVNPS